MFDTRDCRSITRRNTAHPVLASALAAAIPGMCIAGPTPTPEHVRGIHVTVWVAGSPAFRTTYAPLLGPDRINTVVIPVKEYPGDLYLSGVPGTAELGIPVIPLRDAAGLLRWLKDRGVYTIARLVVFKDTRLAERLPECAVKRPDGSLWRDRRGNAWTDPFNRTVWRYNVAVASRALAMGFDEIQFDYIRFPSDGDTAQCRYSQPYTSSGASRALFDFLAYAREQLSSFGAPISIDVFGLTPSVDHCMGIGQHFRTLALSADYISPMIYPSHYARGSYGIPDPDAVPYDTVYHTVRDALRHLGEERGRLRPYLQDFSLRHRYGNHEVAEQIRACYDQGVFDWLLWSPSVRYSTAAVLEMASVRPGQYVRSRSSDTVIGVAATPVRRPRSPVPARIPVGEMPAPASEDSRASTGMHESKRTGTPWEEQLSEECRDYEIPEWWNRAHTHVEEASVRRPADTIGNAVLEVRDYEHPPWVVHPQITCGCHPGND
jgi:hypothetical protein